MLFWLRREVLALARGTREAILNCLQLFFSSLPLCRLDGAAVLVVERGPAAVSRDSVHGFVSVPAGLRPILVGSAC